MCTKVYLYLCREGKFGETYQIKVRIYGVKMHSHSSVALSNNCTGQLERCHLEEDPENRKAIPIPMQEFFSGSSLKDELPKLTFQRSHWDTRA